MLAAPALGSTDRFEVPVGDCGSGATGKARACKNCTCGRAQSGGTASKSILAQAQPGTTITIDTSQMKSSCGSVLLLLLSLLCHEISRAVFDSNRSLMLASALWATDSAAQVAPTVVCRPSSLEKRSPLVYESGREEREREDFCTFTAAMFAFSSVVPDVHPSTPFWTLGNEAGLFSVVFLRLVLSNSHSAISSLSTHFWLLGV